MLLVAIVALAVTDIGLFVVTAVAFAAEHLEQYV